MQKKEELLSQLDNALKRKVQQKYMKQSKAADTLNQQFYGNEGDKSKYNTKQQPKHTTNSNHLSKSPVVSHHKQPIFKSQNNINIKTSHSPVQSPKLQTQRDVNYEQTSSIKMGSSIQEENSQAKLKDEVKRLKQKNAVLEKQINQFKYNIGQLQNQSKRLRRDQTQYTKLKHQNGNLMKEIEFIRAKNNDNRLKKDNNQNLLNQQQLSKIMMQLNINLLNKQTLPQSLKSISLAIAKLIDEKNKVAAKLNNFDIESILIKQNNIAYKKQLQILSKENQQLQTLIQQDCVKIEELESMLESYKSEKKQLQARYKQTNKELQGLKRQFKLIVQGSKHSKPKRQQPSVRNKENIIQNSVVKMYNDQEAQVQSYTQEPKTMQTKNDEQKFILLQKMNQLNLYIQKLQERAINTEKDKTVDEGQMLQRICQLNQQIQRHEQTILRNNLQNQQHKQTIYKCEEYIKELQYKCEQIQKDINQFIPQLKQMEQENSRLKNEQLYKDQQIIHKITTINQFRNTLEEAEEKLSIAQLQLNKEIFQGRLAKGQIERLQNQIFYLKKKQNDLQVELSRKANQFHSELESSNIEKSQRERQLITKLKEYQRIASQKTDQISKLNNQCAFKQKQLKLFKSKIQSLSQSHAKIVENTNIQSKKLAETKQMLRLKIIQARQNEQSNNHLLQDYDFKIKELRQNLKRFESYTNNFIQQFSKQEKLYKNMRQQKSKLENSNQLLALKNDQLSKQIFSYRCDVQRLSFDSKNNCQLKQYYQQVSSQLKAKLQELFHQLTKTQKEKAQLIEKLNTLQNIKHQYEMQQTQVHYSWQHKNEECESLKNQLYALSQQYNLLSQQYIGFRQESQRLQRERFEQITHQNYDMERLIRESKDLKLRIEQLSSLSESNHFRQSENDKRMAVLTQQNRSLLKKNEILVQEIQMKMANSQQDQYLSQLKNRQYCILLKKILTDIISEQELESCNNFEVLLELGSERVIRRKRQIRDEQSQLRKQTVKSQYELQQYISEPIRRIYIGTQISSSEEIMCRNFGQTDQILQVESNIKQGLGKESNDTPRSFKFSMSPYQQRKQKRTQRLISCFNSKIQNKSNVSENKHE